MARGITASTGSMLTEAQKVIIGTVRTEGTAAAGRKLHRRMVRTHSRATTINTEGREGHHGLKALGENVHDAGRTQDSRQADKAADVNGLRKGFAFGQLVILYNLNAGQHQKNAGCHNNEF